MSVDIWVVNGYFDGQRFSERGPHTIVAEDGRIASIEQGDFAGAIKNHYRALRGFDATVVRVPFLMPGLAEAHAHLFLDGAELDPKKRMEYLKADQDTMLDVARRSVQDSYSHGVTLIRDAGDIHGINTQVKEEFRGRSECPVIRAAGRGLRKVKRYGSFLAIEAADTQSIAGCIEKIAPYADDIKVLLTGIIDFKTGQMVGSPQFTAEESRLIVSYARSYGKKTLTHCSGLDGLRIAVEAGFDSIEHGFFMDRSILCQMTNFQIAWVPTFSPVAFQRDRPELAGWDRDTVGRLDEILDNHYAHLLMAHQLGVPIVAGSDAGSYGVPHGAGLVEELVHADRAGVPLEANLASATSVPRRLWGCPSADIRAGNTVDMIALPGSPFELLDNLRHVISVYRTVGRDAVAA